MKYKNGKPIEGTRDELYKIFDKSYRDYYRSFAEFEFAFMKNGGEIIEDDGPIFKKSNRSV